MKEAVDFLPILLGEQSLPLEGRPTPANVKIAAEIILNKEKIRDYLKDQAQLKLERKILDPQLKQEIERVTQSNKTPLFYRGLVKFLNLSPEDKQRLDLIEQIEDLLKDHHLIAVAGFRLQDIELKYFFHREILKKLEQIRQSPEILKGELSKINAVKGELEPFNQRTLQDVPDKIKNDLKKIQFLPEITSTGLEPIMIVLDELDLTQALIEIYVSSSTR